MLLHAKSKMISIHKKMEIMNEADEIMYTVESKAISIHDTTYVRNAAGEPIATISHKPISLHETHIIEFADGEQVEVRTEWFHVMRDVIDLEGLGWQLRGDVLQHNYEFVNQLGAVLARTHQKWVSLHDVYYIDVLDESQLDRIVAIYVALERIIREREIRRENESSAAAMGGAAAMNNGGNNGNP